jgi:hypothetical protein
MRYEFVRAIDIWNFPTRNCKIKLRKYYTDKIIKKLKNAWPEIKTFFFYFCKNSQLFAIVFYNILDKDNKI